LPQFTKYLSFAKEPHKRDLNFAKETYDIPQSSAAPDCTYSFTLSPPQVNGGVERQRYRKVERQRDRETARQRDSETERQRDRETERQRDRERLVSESVGEEERQRQGGGVVHEQRQRRGGSDDAA